MDRRAELPQICRRERPRTHRAVPRIFRPSCERSNDRLCAPDQPLAWTLTYLRACQDLTGRASPILTPFRAFCIPLGGIDMSSGRRWMPIYRHLAERIAIRPRPRGQDPDTIAVRNLAGPQIRHLVHCHLTSGAAHFVSVPLLKWGMAMSRAQGVATLASAEAPFVGPGQRLTRTAPKPRLLKRPSTSCHLDRAMLLWPRLDRAKIRRFADDPARIAEIVEARTSQPYDVILAMLTRQTPAP